MGKYILVGSDPKRAGGGEEKNTWIHGKSLGILGVLKNITAKVYQQILAQTVFYLSLSQEGFVKQGGHRMTS